MLHGAQTLHNTRKQRTFYNEKSMLPGSDLLRVRNEHSACADELGVDTNK